MDWHRTRLVCGANPEKPFNSCEWRAVCTICSWESNRYDALELDCYEQAKLDGRVHEQAPDGASNIDAVLANWVRR